VVVVNYRQWLSDGSRWYPATPIDQFAAKMRGHGFLVYVLGAVGTHLDIASPEDHAPFSHTPWPGVQPYPAVLACDIMPGGSVDWRDLGQRIVADKNAGVHGTEWIKYINWTDPAGNCWHDSWEPHHVQVPSSDRGHLHISGRTDYVTSTVVFTSDWDPVDRLSAPNPAPTTGDDMPSGEIPAGFAFDEHGNWLDPSKAVAVPLPAVGTGPGQWGEAWLWLAATGGATVRHGVHQSGAYHDWADHALTLLTTAGPIGLAAGSDALILGRRKASATDTADSAPVRWHVQYAA
jgi:hypothetical protein